GHARNGPRGQDDENGGNEQQGAITPVAQYLRHFAYFDRSAFGFVHELLEKAGETAFVAAVHVFSCVRFALAAGHLPLFPPPFFPPLRLALCVSFFPRPEPDLLPPPDSLFTVAQARLSASFSGVPRFLYPS